VTDAEGSDIIEKEIQGAEWRTDGHDLLYRQRVWRGCVRALAGGRLMGDTFVVRQVAECRGEQRNVGLAHSLIRAQDFGGGLGFGGERSNGRTEAAGGVLLGGEPGGAFGRAGICHERQSKTQTEQQCAQSLVSCLSALCCSAHPVVLFQDVVLFFRPTVLARLMAVGVSRFFNEADGSAARSEKHGYTRFHCFSAFVPCFTARPDAFSVPSGFTSSSVFR
jgi:hypothetical protein